MKLTYSLSKVLLAFSSMLAQLCKREECHNIASTVGTHPTGALAMECQGAAINTRYLLVTKGSADNQFIINQAATRPWGVVADEPNVGEQATVLLCGCMPGTMKMVAAGPIAVGSAVYTVSNGQVSQVFSATAYMVGRALSPTNSAGDLLEVAHCFPLLNATAL